MTKKGFTLIELIVSIVLVGVILASMIGTLLSLKDTYSVINEDVEARTYSALISKTINEHVMKNNGIKSVTCAGHNKCILKLGTNKIMTLEIVTADVNTTPMKDNNSGSTIGSIIERATTIEYYGEDYSYYKTLKNYDRHYNNGNKDVESGYRFTGIEYTTSTYTNNESTMLLDYLANITIKLNNPKYNIEIYSSTQVDEVEEIRLYELTYNSNGGSTCPNNPKVALDGRPWGALCVPTKSGYGFLGWFLQQNGINVREITSSTVADESITVYAQWSDAKYTCPAGKYLPASSTECETCAANSYCPGVTNVPYNKFEDQGIIKCLSGYSSSEGSTKVTDCKFRCNENTYMQGVNNSYCSACPNGYIRSAHYVDQGKTSECVLKNVDKPDITSTDTSIIYGSEDVTLTCNHTTTYGSDVTKMYQFGYATSEANYRNGTITWIGSPGTSNTYKISKDAYVGDRYYGCRVSLVVKGTNKYNCTKNANASGYSCKKSATSSSETKKYSCTSSNYSNPLSFCQNNGYTSQSNKCKKTQLYSGSCWCCEKGGGSTCDSTTVKNATTSSCSSWAPSDATCTGTLSASGHSYSGKITCERTAYSCSEGELCDTSYCCQDSTTACKSGWETASISYTCDGVGGSLCNTSKCCSNDVNSPIDGWSCSANSNHSCPNGGTYNASTGNCEYPTTSDYGKSYISDTYSLVTIKNAKVVFDANSGTLNGTSPLYSKKGANVFYTSEKGSTTASAPTASKTGYNTNGWYTAESSGSKVLNANGTFTGTAVSGYTNASTWQATVNRTLYAQYVAKTYELTLNKNNATNSPTSKVTVTYNSNSVSPSSITIPQRKYTVKGFSLDTTRKSNGATVSSTNDITSTYTFNGWYTSASGGSKVLSNATSPVLQSSVAGYTDSSGKWTRDSGETLYARWSDGSVTLPTIAKTGYTCGWTSSSTGTTITYNSGASFTPTSATTLYGVCIPQEYTIKYACGSGTGTPPTSHTVKYDETVTIKSNTCTAPSGNKFAKWNDPTGDNGWTGWSGQWKYSNGQYGITSNTLTLTAQYVAKTYELTLDKNNATNSPTSKVTVTYNSNSVSPSSITLPQRKYTVKGFSLDSTRKSNGATVSSTNDITSTYTFNGWYTTNSGGSKVISNATSPVLQSSVAGYTDSSGKWTRDGEVTLYAGWSGESITLPTITKTGYTCGWTASSTGTTITYNSGASFTPTAATTLYGVCIPHEYTIKYACGSGTGTPPTSHTVKYDETVTIKSNTCTKTSYSFTTWNDPTGDNGWTGWNGQWKYSNGQYGITSNTLTLTAQWKETNKTVTCNSSNWSTRTSDSNCPSGYKYSSNSCSRSASGYSYSGNINCEKTTYSCSWLEFSSSAPIGNKCYYNSAKTCEKTATITCKCGANGVPSTYHDVTLTSTNCTNQCNNYGQTLISQSSDCDSRLISGTKICRYSAGYVSDCEKGYSISSASCNSSHATLSSDKKTCSYNAKGSTETETPSCTSSNWSNKASACSSGYTYSTDNCTRSATGYNYTGNITCTLK